MPGRSLKRPLRHIIGAYAAVLAANSAAGLADDTKCWEVVQYCILAVRGNKWRKEDSHGKTVVKLVN